MPTTAAPAPAAKPAEEARKFDAKAAIAQACALAGVSSCSVIFTDGLIIAGNIPDDMHMEGLSAVAPTMLKKLEKHMCETQLGPLACMTVHGEKSPVTFFSAGNLCLTAVHNGTELSAESRRELSRITQELSRTYPQLETAHVNH
jgi:predicted regulator of Ras-like GTPase activity (Roadblock/LC7/MglB family)